MSVESHQGQGGNDSEHRRPWLLAGAVAGALVIGGVAGGFIATSGGSSSASATGSVCNASTVANNVLPSIVTIQVRSGTTGGTGSGEVIRNDGYILTNNHVISAAAEGGSISVLFSDGSTMPATLTGRDPQADLAVIKVNTSKKLPTITFGSSSNVEVGQPVVVLGAPLGLSSTVTSGIVSALDRTIEVPGDKGETALLASAVQTDASINPGNSGGAMTNCSGQLIGVPSAGASVPSSSGESSGGSVGLGFAIPVSTAETISNEIIETGHANHGYFGIQIVQIPPAAAKQAGTPEGLYVVRVIPNGPSAKAGLQAGDIITELNGQAATDPNQLEALTLTERAGDKVTITYVRDGQTHTTTVTLENIPVSTKSSS
jgi:putative serine protease PepD